MNARHSDRLAHGDTVWRLTYDVNFRPAKSGTGIRAALPYSTQHNRVFRETFLYPESSMYLVRNRRTQGREAIAVALAGSNPSRFVADFDIHVSPRHRWSPQAPDEELTTAERKHYLQAEKAVQIDSSPVTDFLSALAEHTITKSEILERIFEYCSEDLASDPDNGPLDAAGALQKGAAGTLGRARAMVALCRASQLPARLVSGFVLDNEQQPRPHVWVEAYMSKQWIPYDPENGCSRDLPPTYLPVRRDDSEVIKAFDTADFHAKFSVQRLHPPFDILVAQQGRWLDIFHLTRLAPSMQRMLALLLLFPLGALITTIFRNLIGIQTFGTFTPSLLALSLVHADWRTGLMVFVVVMGIGLAGRALLNQLRLLTVARLSVVITLVVLSLTMAVSALDYLRWSPAAQTVLLPMVIMTMTIERFHISSEEDGLRCALKILAGTFVVAFCSFMVLRLEGLGRLALSFPEGEFFVIAALILIGRYAGYRLTELWRFRDIGKAPYSEDVK